MWAKATLSQADDYRYHALKPLLRQYQRPITFLHLWPNKSYVACVLAEKYDGVNIVLTPQAHTYLESCTPYNNMVLLNADLSIKGLKYLGECEHFDVTLVHNVAEIFSMDWKKAIDNALTMGDYIIFEAPQNNSKLYRPFVDYLKKKGAERIAQPDNAIALQAGELYQCAPMKKYLIKRRWNYKNNWTRGEYTIDSSFTHKKFIKNKTKPKGYSVTAWHPGINLYTFKQLNGLYPSHETIRSMLYPLATLKHNDLRLFNLIIQGNKLTPIDIDENERNADPKVLLPGIIAQFRSLKKLQLIQEFECPQAETYEDYPLDTDEVEII